MTFAFFFESVGGGEWLVLLAVILVVVGPKNLPSAARKMGQILSQLRRAADEFKRQIMTMDQEVAKAVDDVKKDCIDTSMSDSSSSGPDYDPSSSYPGHEDYYDATDYQNEYGDGASTTESVTGVDSAMPGADEGDDTKVPETTAEPVVTGGDVQNAAADK